MADWEELDDIVLTPEEQAEVDALVKRLKLSGPSDGPDDDLDDLIELDDDDEVLAATFSDAEHKDDKV